MGTPLTHNGWIGINMASIIDNSTALNVMRESNEDILELIRNLKALLNGSGSVTFNIGGSPITVSSLSQLIDNYRTGRFASLILGGQSTGGYEVKLTASADGSLSVTDINGNPVFINSRSIASSNIDNCTVKEVSADGCTLTRVEGRATVTGGTVNTKGMTVGDFKATTLTGTSATVDTISVNESIVCPGILSIGSRRLSVQNVRELFKSGNKDLNNYSSLLQTTWDYRNPKWDVNGRYSPRDIGFTDTLQLPGMMRINGNNSYQQFVGFKPTNIKGVAPENIGNPVGIMGGLFFPSLMAWPFGYIDSTNNLLNLCTFKDEDVGKDIYYMTGSSSWSIYRTMSIVGSVATFGNAYEIPPYSCIKFIVEKRLLEDGNTLSILEIA